MRMKKLFYPTETISSWCEHYWLCFKTTILIQKLQLLQVRSRKYFINMCMGPKWLINKKLTKTQIKTKQQQSRRILRFVDIALISFWKRSQKTQETLQRYIFFMYILSVNCSNDLFLAEKYPPQFFGDRLSTHYSLIKS